MARAGGVSKKLRRSILVSSQSYMTSRRGRPAPAVATAYQQNPYRAILCAVKLRALRQPPLCGRQKSGRKTGHLISCLHAGRTRSSRRTGRQGRVFDARLIASERMQPGGNRLDFAFIKLLAQLTCTHNGDGHFQVPDFATVEVRSRQGDVAQRAGTEHIFVRCRRGNSEATFVVGGKNIRTRTLDYPKREIALPAYVDARVAGHATFIDEKAEPLDFEIAHAVLAGQELVKARVGRYKGAFKRFNGFGHVVEGHRFFFTWKSLGE